METFEPCMEILTALCSHGILKDTVHLLAAGLGD